MVNLALPCNSFLMTFFTAFILGLVSSLHCLSMSGPLQIGIQKAWIKKAGYSSILTYHFSRIFTYGVLAALASLIGLGLGWQYAQKNIALISGLLLLFGFLSYHFFQLDRSLMKVFQPLLSRFRNSLQKSNTSSFKYFGLSGILNGLLPCGMVYVALFPAAASGSFISSFIFMLSFGLGTLILLISFNLGVEKISFLRDHQRLLVSISVLILASLLILRGLNLDIPYLSPGVTSDINNPEVCD